MAPNDETNSEELTFDQRIKLVGLSCTEVKIEKYKRLWTQQFDAIGSVKISGGRKTEPEIGEVVDGYTVCFLEKTLNHRYILL